MILKYHQLSRHSQPFILLTNIYWSPECASHYGLGDEDTALNQMLDPALTDVLFQRRRQEINTWATTECRVVRNKPGKGVASDQNTHGSPLWGHSKCSEAKGKSKRQPHRGGGGEQPSRQREHICTSLESGKGSPRPGHRKEASLAGSLFSLTLLITVKPNLETLFLVSNAPF